MSYRLLINPGTPQAWEIQLKPGANRIGRNEENDFTLSHESVSGTHCEITVSDAGIFLKDLGSTNGTFVNRTPVTESQLQPGQHIQLGQVDMTFEAGGAKAVSAPPPPMAIPIPVPVPGSVRSPPASPSSSPSSFGARISKGQAEEPARPDPKLEEASNSTPTMDAVNAVCKSHPKTPARFLCSRCQKYFCDLCVNTRGMEKYCRVCGIACTSLRVQAARPVAEKSFFRWRFWRWR